MSAEVIKHTEDGFDWMLREGSEDWLGPSEHEQWLWPIFTSLLPSDGVFLDVGAHVGHYAVRLARRCKWVLAVEPNPETCVALAQNAVLNNVANLYIIPVAASDHEGTVGLENPHDSFAGGSTFVTEEGEVQCSRLDDCVDVDRLDLVKVDVEGHEVQALRGMTGLLLGYRPRLILELHDRLYPGKNIERDVKALLESVSYDFDSLGGNEHVEYLLCSPKETPSLPADPEI